MLKKMISLSFATTMNTFPQFDQMCMKIAKFCSKPILMAFGDDEDDDRGSGRIGAFHRYGFV